MEIVLFLIKNFGQAIGTAAIATIIRYAEKTRLIKHFRNKLQAIEEKSKKDIGSSEYKDSL